MISLAPRGMALAVFETMRLFSDLVLLDLFISYGDVTQPRTPPGPRDQPEEIPIQEPPPPPGPGPDDPGGGEYPRRDPMLPEEPIPAHRDPGTYYSRSN